MEQEKKFKDSCILLLAILLTFSIFLNIVQGDCISNLIKKIKGIERTYQVFDYSTSEEQAGSLEYSAW